MKIKIIVILFLLILTCNNCISFIDCKYNLTKSYISSTCKMETHFKIAKLKDIESFNNKGRPEKFKTDTIVTISHIGNKYESKEEIEIRNELGIIREKFEFAFKPQKKIYFFKENRYYCWSFIEPLQRQIKYKTLPIRFNIGEWYLFSGLELSGQSYFQIFLYVEETGKLKIINNYRYGPY
jgi:hypothetical protein